VQQRVRRKLVPFLVAATLSLTLALPAAADTVSYTTRETGSTECSFNQQIRTRIVADGHHRHGMGTYIYNHYLFYRDTRVYWGVFAGTWSLSQQFGYSNYSFLQSGAECVAS